MKLEQDGEIAHLLWNLVDDHRQRRGDPERDGSMEGRGDHHAVDEVVKAIPDQDERCGAGVHCAVVRVAVAPEHDLLEHEEEDEAGQHGRGHGIDRRLRERRRDHAEEGGGEQGPGRIAQQPGEEELPDAGGDRSIRAAPATAPRFEIATAAMIHTRMGVDTFSSSPSRPHRPVQDGVPFPPGDSPQCSPRNTASALAHTMPCCMTSARTRNHGGRQCTTEAEIVAGTPRTTGRR